jgi:hypothetical protein
MGTKENKKQEFHLKRSWTFHRLVDGHPVMHLIIYGGEGQGIVLT